MEFIKIPKSEISKIHSEFPRPSDRITALGEGSKIIDNHRPYLEKNIKLLKSTTFKIKIVQQNFGDRTKNLAQK